MKAWEEWWVSDVSSSSSGSETFSGESSTHNKYSAHPPLTCQILEGQLCHLPSTSVTSCSIAVARSACLDIHVKPKVIRHRQHPSRLSKGFSVKCLGLKLPKISSNVLICHQFYHFYFSIVRKVHHLIYFIDYYFASFLPFLPNRAALVFVTHFCKKLPGIQSFFDVATETRSSSGPFPLTQKAVVLGVPSWLAVGSKFWYSLFSLEMISSRKWSKSAHNLSHIVVV